MAIERYTRPEMGNIWTDQRKFQSWVEVEIAVLAVKQQLKIIPPGIALKVSQNWKFTVAEIEKREKITRHDMLAFVQVISESLPEEARPFLHAGLTSYDVEDTGLAIQLKESLELIEEEMLILLAVLGKMAKEYKHTPQIGRTHGVHAEPITFGKKILDWYDEIERHLNKIKANKPEFLVGKISGAVGTYANIDPRIEEIICQMLDIYPARISTQIVSRDRHALYIFLLASLASSLEKFATEIRNLHRTEIREIQEPSKGGQGGSSAMPHKKALPNPISAENISSLSRLIRGFVISALENQTYCWHERSLDNSATERIIFADASIYVHYLLGRFIQELRDLKVYPERMLENLNLTRGIIFSEDVMIALTGKGMAREDAHTLLQDLTLKSWETGQTFKHVLISNPKIMELLSIEEIDDCLRPENHLKNIDQIFARFGF